MNSTPPPGPGHNAPPESGLRWRAHCWRRAKAAVPQPRLTQAQLRRRIARAEELGLTYAQYASIRLATGRDPAAMLLSPEGMRLRLARRLDMPGPVREKLAALRHCRLIALSPSEEPAADFLEELRDISGLPFAAAAPSPPPGAGWGAIRGAVLPVLHELSLPRGAAIMIGAERAAEPGIAAALGAPFLQGDIYFAPPA